MWGGPAQPGVLPRVERPRNARVAEHLLLAAARVGACAADGSALPRKELFVLSAAVAEAAMRADYQALQLSLDAIGVLIDAAPDGPAWGSYRGHLDATLEFAWLLSRETRTHDSLPES